MRAIYFLLFDSGLILSCWILISGSLRAQPVLPARPSIDEQRFVAHGIRRVTGKHLVLYTDLPIDDSIEELPKVFDLAVVQWSKYFETPLSSLEDWRLVAYLIKDKRPFKAVGALPDDLPPFRNGFQRSWEIWLYEQPSRYYRRHLLLHEGTHAFMAWKNRAMGPPWYMEGMAELFGTHLWQDGRLTMACFPKSKEQFSHWGRIRIIKDEVAQGRAHTLVGVLKLPPNAHLRNEPYAWCWAASWFLRNHPLSSKAFAELKDKANDTSDDFSRQFYDRMRPQWDDLNEQWQLLVMNIDYGYDLSRALIQRKPSVDLPPEGAEVDISATHGWQSTGLRLSAGETYRIRATGRYQVASKPRVWWCEPGGVTIRYHNKMPLGKLLGAVRDDKNPPRGLTPLARPQQIGLLRTLPCERSGTLYLKINESSAELHDNAGRMRVRIHRAS